MAKPRSSRGDGACRYYDVFSPMPTKVSKQVGMVDIGVVGQISIWDFFGVVLWYDGARGESGQG